MKTEKSWNKSKPAHEKTGPHGLVFMCGALLLDLWLLECILYLYELFV